MNNAANIKIEPMNVIFGDDVAQVQKITCVADDSGSLENKYLFIYSALNEKKYHVYFDTGTGVDPDPGGSTAVKVTILEDATASAVADAVKTALDALDDFSATASGAVVTVTNAANGYATRAHEGDDTGFNFEVVTQGDKAEGAGYIEGEIQLQGLGEDLEPVTAQQEGSTVLAHLRKGNPELSITVTFKETSKAQLRRVFLSSGSTHTPSGPGSSELFGLGTSKQFSSTLGQAKRLTLHPVRKSAADKSDDWNFWKAYLTLDSLNFSGETAFNVPVTFMIYPDRSKPDDICYLAVGDGSQLDS